LVDFYPKTGRTHQLRKHAANQLGMPILGDTRYGGKIHNDFAKTNKPKLHLFAAEITMPIEATPWRVGQTCLNVKLEEPTFFS
jgi:23S rRNA-/tRNA-specific pseudouridylate synthase